MRCSLRAVLHGRRGGVSFIPVRNGDEVTGELSRVSELPNIFLESSRWLEPLHENILQAGQHFCNSAPNELLQGGRNTWRKFLG